MDRFELARKKLSSGGGKNAGGLEGDYAVAFQRLVRLGLRPQLRRKYRA
jgi:hypothetical protein